MVKLPCGTGIRLMKCVSLRVRDVDFGRREIIIREGKGFKGRVTGYVGFGVGDAVK